MSLKKSVEISWFAPICNGDDKYLGYHDDKYKSNWKNASKIVKTAQKRFFCRTRAPPRVGARKTGAFALVYVDF